MQHLTVQSGRPMRDPSFNPRARARTAYAPHVKIIHGIPYTAREQHTLLTPAQMARIVRNLCRVQNRNPNYQFLPNDPLTLPDANECINRCVRSSEYYIANVI